MRDANATRRGCLALLVALLACVGPAPRPAAAAGSIDSCTQLIFSLPATLNAPGTWCVAANLSSSLRSANAINITANNVTLDCNHAIIDGSAAGPKTTAVGVAGANVLNATIRRCDIRGFLQAVRLVGSTGGHLVEDNRFHKNTWIGATVQGAGSIVRRNLVFATGGTETSDFAVGIATAQSVDVEDNIVSGVSARLDTDGNAYGIQTEANAAGTLSGNLVRGVVAAGWGTQWAIYNSNSGRVAVLDNDLVSSSDLRAVGVRCHDSLGGARGNTLNGFNNAIVGCTTDGGNVVGR